MDTSVIEAVEQAYLAANCSTGWDNGINNAEAFVKELGKCGYRIVKVDSSNSPPPPPPPPPTVGSLGSIF